MGRHLAIGTSCGSKGDSPASHGDASNKKRAAQSGDALLATNCSYMPAVDRATYTCCGASTLPCALFIFTLMVCTSPDLPLSGDVKATSYWFSSRRSRSL